MQLRMELGVDFPNQRRRGSDEQLRHRLRLRPHLIYPTSKPPIPLFTKHSSVSHSLFARGISTRVTAPIAFLWTFTIPFPAPMFRHSVRRLAIAAAKAAEPSAYTVAVSSAQGVSKGLTGGALHVPA